MDEERTEVICEFCGLDLSRTQHPDDLVITKKGTLFIVCPDCKRTTIIKGFARPRKKRVFRRFDVNSKR